jgi:hypothetical protein
VREKEEEHIPIIGPSIDRRMLALVTQVANSKTIEAASCFVCAARHTFVQSWDNLCDARWPATSRNMTVSWRPVRYSLWKWEEQNSEAFLDTFSLPRFKERYASDNRDDGNAFVNASEVADGNSEWQRTLLFQEKGLSLRVLCCPEDVKRAPSCKHALDTLCGDCTIPICGTCQRDWYKNHQKIPMSLANDNLWGYSSDIIVKYKVRWIEAAIVSPCWTNIIIYYVEGDHGHLLNENLGNQSYRTVVRGSCCSYHMPWEDIVDDLQANCSDRNVSAIPRAQDALKYMLRLHVTLNGFDFKKHLKQVQVRPFVLLQLLYFLIDRNHEVFRGKGSAQDLKRRMEAAVALKYPEREGDIPEALREGFVPACVLEAHDEMQKQLREKTSTGLRIACEKNATPGDGARSLDTCLDELRPHSIDNDRSASAVTDPSTMRTGAIDRYGMLNVNIASKRLLQFHSKYFSQALPFVIPRMVSGPDFFPHQRWRRPDTVVLATYRIHVPARLDSSADYPECCIQMDGGTHHGNRR